MDKADQPILVVGESLIDVITHAGREPVEQPGGSPANVAVGLSRLGQVVELATWFTADARGQRIRTWLESDGVAITPGSDHAVRTSAALARIGPTGTADYEFDLVDNLPELRPGHRPPLLHVGSIAALREPSAAKVTRLVEAVAAVATITYDPNVRPAVIPPVAESRARVEALVSRSDVVKVSDEDLDWLAPGQDPDLVVRRWSTLGPAFIVLTRGASGALAVTANGDRIEVTAPRVTVADTVGAGDSFMAGIIDGLARAELLGAPFRERLRAAEGELVHRVLARAAKIAAITVSRLGADPPRLTDLPAEELGTPIGRSHGPT